MICRINTDILFIALKRMLKLIVSEVLATVELIGYKLVKQQAIKDVYRYPLTSTIQKIAMRYEKGGCL
jgi:hypothetical protein